MIKKMSGNFGLTGFYGLLTVFGYSFNIYRMIKIEVLTQSPPSPIKSKIKEPTELASLKNRAYYDIFSFFQGIGLAE